jgi:tetratricopeptide (TPR) repeat protein
MARDPGARFQSAAALREALIEVRARSRDPVAQTGGPAPGLTDPRITDAGYSTPAPAPARWRVPVFAGAGVVAAVLISVFAYMWSRPLSDNRPATPIAVLPAINLAGEPATGELGSSLVAILTSNLSAVQGVTVVSHATVTGFLNPDRNVDTIARELGAGYVVDLAIGRRGDLLRVTGRLTSPGVRDAIWQDTVEGDALAIHRGVVDRVAVALERAGVFRRALTAADRARLRVLPTTDAQALVEYARGSAALDRDTDAPGVQAAADAFASAIARDPSFALAHAGLAQAYAAMYTTTSDAVWVGRAASAAGRALELDPAQAPVHVSLARVYFTEGQLPDAERHARVAVTLAPDSDDAHRLLGRILCERGDIEAGLEEARTAVRLRPDYWVNSDSLGYLLYRAARYEDAIAPYRRVVTLRPGFPGGYQSLGTVLHYTGRIDEANGNYEHALRLGPEATAYSSLAFGYYSAGRFREARDNYLQAISLDPTSPVSYYNLGDTERRLNEPAAAKKAFEDALTRSQARLAVNPNDAHMIALAAVCEAKLGRAGQARQHAVEAAALKRDNSDVVYKLAVVQALAGDADAAMTTLTRAIGLGYPRSFARADWDLASLAARDDFKTLTTMPAPGTSK